MLRLANVKDVIIQADYMSGDRNTIASALRVNNELGILVIAAAGHDAAGQALKEFYIAASSAQRVELYTAPFTNPNAVPPTPKTVLSEVDKKKLAEAQAKAIEANKIAAADEVHKVYKKADFWCRARRENNRGVVASGKYKSPPWVVGCVEVGVRIHPASFGTGEIAKAFKDDATDTRKKLRTYWRLPNDEVGTSLYAAVGEYLRSKGFRDNRRYVFLFTKEGDRNAEKAHHFTSILTWRILQERIEREKNIIPVAVGDDIGLRTNPRMVKFWDDAEWKKIFEGHPIDPRTAQLGMWCYLAEKYQGVSIIGMRSGMIEVPALLGIHTLYLEEKHNQQAKRMAKWLGGVVPGYARQIVEVPGGIKQQIYWNQASLQRNDKENKATYDHAVAKGGHLAGVKMGFESKKGDDLYKGRQFAIGTSEKPAPPQVGRSLAARQPDTLDVGEKPGGIPEQRQAVVKAVFGSEGLAPTLPAEKFMLQTSEFDAIVKWVGENTPMPDGATNAVHGFIDGKLAKKGEALNCTTAIRGEKTWSEYFKSPEYIKKVGANKALELVD